MLPTCRFYCLGYSANNSYRGLDNFHSASLWAFVFQSHALSLSDRAFVEYYCTHYILDECDELSVLTPGWFVDTRHLQHLASRLPDTPRELAELAYYVIGAVNIRGYDEAVLRKTQFIITGAQHLGFREQDHPVTFLGYDLVEPHSHWSVLTHTNEWGSQPFRGNQHGLCPTFDDAQAWLQQYSGSNDAFKLRADENVIVALYELAKV